MNILDKIKLNKLFRDNSNNKNAIQSINALLSEIVNSGTPIKCKVSSSTSQSILSGDWNQYLIFNNVLEDENSLFSTSTPTKITIKTSGTYLIYASVDFAYNGTGYRCLHVRLNHSSSVITDSKMAITDGNVTSLNAVGIVDLSANDYIELRAYQDSSVDLSVSSQTFSIIKIAGIANVTNYITESGNDLITSLDGIQYKLSLNENNEIIAERVQDQLEDFQAGRLLVWHDEFDGKVLDNSKWQHEYTGCRIRQYYPTDTNRNSYLQDSMLVLKAFRENPYTGYDWSGASLNTNNKAEFRYGRFEVKMKFDSAIGTYCSFWTLGANYDRTFNIDANTNDETVGVLWPTCGEIDIAEFNGSTVAGNVHYASDSSNTHVQVGGTDYEIDQTQWHIYALEWTSDTMSFYVDNVLKKTFTISNATVGSYNPFKLPQFIMLNHGVGDGTVGVTPASNTNELTTYVDWVRVYAPVDVTSLVLEDSISLDNTSLALSIGSTQLLSVTFSPDNTCDKTLVWESHNPSIATCYGGKITAIATGTTIITATSKTGKRVSCRVIVS